MKYHAAVAAPELAMDAGKSKENAMGMVYRVVAAVCGST
jgi:hypothetical protein